MFFTTYSGAACTLIAEQAPARGLEVPPVTAENHARIRPTLPDVVTVSNPFDLALPWQHDSPVKMEDAQSIATCLMDACEGEVDAIAFLQDIPRAGGGRDQTWLPAIEAMIEIARKTGLPSIVSSLFPEGLEPSIRRHALANGVSPLMGLPECLESLAGTVRYRRALEVMCEFAETPPLLAVAHPPENPVVIDEWQSKQTLARYGVRFPTGWAGPSHQAVQAAEEIGYPVVVKALSADLPHKSQVGGVHLSLYDTAAVTRAIEAIEHDVSWAMPDLAISEVLVEEMVTDGLLELLVGVKCHPALGMALVVGRGGTEIASIGTHALALLPATDRELHGAIAQLDLGLTHEANKELLAILRSVESYALDHLDELRELDVNPVIVRADDSVLAVDALAVPGRLSACEQ